MVGAALWVLEDVTKTLSAAAARFFFSMAEREHKTAFCWRLRFFRRCVVPLLKTAAVMRAMCAIVARGAFIAVSSARDTASALVACPFLGERTADEERLKFSTSGVLDGEG